MGIVQREINGRAIYEAMKLKGDVEHIRGEWFTFDEVTGAPTSGCALGLIAINLGIKGEQSINQGANLLDQLNKFEVPLDSKWHIDGSHIGDTIIYWNDLRSSTGYGYQLATFEDVHQMVHDVLEPHFADVFTVDEWVWEAPNFAAMEPDYEDYEPEPSYF